MNNLECFKRALNWEPIDRLLYGGFLPLIFDELGADGLNPIERNGCNDILRWRLFGHAAPGCAARVSSSCAPLCRCNLRLANVRLESYAPD